jgi:hypothetical protein
MKHQRKCDLLVITAIIIVSIALGALLILGPATASADELRIRNEGGVEVIVECEGELAVTYDGPVCAVNPVYGDGTAKVAAAGTEEGWLVIEAESITGYTIEVACNQAGEYVVPEAYIVKDAPAEAPQVDSGGGRSIADLDREAFIADCEATYDELVASGSCAIYALV